MHRYSPRYRQVCGIVLCWTRAVIGCRRARLVLGGVAEGVFVVIICSRREGMYRQACMFRSKIDWRLTCNCVDRIHSDTAKFYIKRSLLLGMTWGCSWIK